MQVKLLELRDAGTFIPIVCINMNPNIVGSYEAQRYLLRRCGYPCDHRPNIAISRVRADGDPFSNDPNHWGGRTFPTAHNYIIEHWDELIDGDVVDVQFILGETTEPKKSERITCPI